MEISVSPAAPKIASNWQFNCPQNCHQKFPTKVAYHDVWVGGPLAYVSSAAFLVGDPSTKQAFSFRYGARFQNIAKNVRKRLGLGPI